MRSSPPSPSAITPTTTPPRSSRSTGCSTERDAVALLQTKATPEEVDEYRRFIVTLAHHVAAAHREHGQDVSAAEQAAIDEIAQALGAAAS